MVLGGKQAYEFPGIDPVFGTSAHTKNAGHAWPSTAQDSRLPRGAANVLSTVVGRHALREPSATVPHLNPEGHPVACRLSSRF